ncbi:unnamed protein product [Periconia digitata]|uniref:Uncharacterized protein n=1 Tax=Periconia digitata TaxID=1303443 RepID=A0A9W4U482_9PLEO|nr:unnamed protein product [Periconia digitata]
MPDAVPEAGLVPEAVAAPSPMRLFISSSPMHACIFHYLFVSPACLLLCCLPVHPHVWPRIATESECLGRSRHSCLLPARLSFHTCCHRFMATYLHTPIPPSLPCILCISPIIIVNFRFILSVRFH